MLSSRTAVRPFHAVLSALTCGFPAGVPASGVEKGWGELYRLVVEPFARA
jgi:hypothetical protein